jgi:hypothetical protein
METQNYNNHSRWVPGFHFLLGSLLFIGLIIAVYNFFRHFDESGRAENLLIILIYFCGMLMFWYLRQFAIKAQDRAIRGEESLRYFVMTGKPIDKRITMGQIIALRFASDEEFVALADKAAAEGLGAKEIKMAVQKWRADHHRA